MFCLIALPVTTTSPTVCPEKTTSGKCCSLPFTYGGVTYNSCTSVNYNRPWCSLDSVYKGRWGNCREYKLTQLKHLLMILSVHKDGYSLFVSVTNHPISLLSKDNIRSMLQYSIQIQASDFQLLHYCGLQQTLVLLGSCVQRTLGDLP